MGAVTLGLEADHLLGIQLTKQIPNIWIRGLVESREEIESMIILGNLLLQGVVSSIQVLELYTSRTPCRTWGVAVAARLTLELSLEGLAGPRRGSATGWVTRRLGGWSWLDLTGFGGDDGEA